MTEDNEQQMEQLFHDHYERMYRLAFALLHDNDVAKDVVSDVFSRLWDKQLIPDQAYLMRSVKNACINIIAKKKRDERLKLLLPLSETDGGRALPPGRTMASSGGLHRQRLDQSNCFRYPIVLS